MARYNEILTGRHNRALQKLFSMKGGPPAPQLASEIQPVHHIMTGSENRYLEGWTKLGTGINMGAVAGQTAGFQLRNPTGSNVVGIIEKLAVMTSIAGEVDFSYIQNVTDLPTPIVAVREDARSAPTLTSSNGVLVLSQANPLVGGNIFGRQWFAANVNQDTIVTKEQEFVVLPGDTFRVNTTVANIVLIAWVIWRERFLEDSERS